MKTLYLVTFFILCVGVLISHGHSHDKAEAPHYKYSKEANEKKAEPAKDLLDDEDMYKEFEKDEKDVPNLPDDQIIDEDVPDKTKSKPKDDGGVVIGEDPDQLAENPVKNKESKQQSKFTVDMGKSSPSEDKHEHTPDEDIHSHKEDHDSTTKDSSADKKATKLKDEIKAKISEEENVVTPEKDREEESKPQPTEKPSQKVDTHTHSHSHSHSHDEHTHAHSHAAPTENKHTHSHAAPTEDKHTHSHSHAEPSEHKHTHSHSHASPTEDKHTHSHSHTEDKAAINQQKPKIPDTRNTLDRLLTRNFLEAMGATLVISVAPIFILLIVPVDNTEKHQPMLKVLLSFASGGLLGDAFLHLIPHAISPHEEPGSHEHAHHGHSHGHDHVGQTIVGVWVVAGILTFLLVEKSIRFLNPEGGAHGHSHAIKESPSASGDESKQHKKNSTNNSALDSKSEKSNKKSGKQAKKVEAPTSIKAAGYLNLAADFAHNFTDGLAIGASFLINRNIGIVTTFTIFFHEIPHEIGDFAILLQSGYSRRKAMLLQFSTALGAMLGTLVSLIAGASVQNSAATSWILPFTAGGFVYIATVSVIPELLQESKPWQTIKEIFALVVGVAMMYLIAIYE